VGESRGLKEDYSLNLVEIIDLEDHVIVLRHVFDSDLRRR
jgi:hypothetical protein